MNNIIKFQNEIVRNAILNSKLQLFEVKQLADMEACFKGQCRGALQAYKHWKDQYNQETDVIELLYGQLKGIILRKNAENTVRAYWIIRRDFRTVFQRYLAENSIYQTRTETKKIA